MKRRRAEESADGLSLMMSSVTSSYSADGLSPAVARYQQIQQMLFALRSSSRKIPAGSICLIPSGQPDAIDIESSRKKADVAKHCNQAQSFQSTKISAEDEFSHSDKSAAKQLTIYEELSKLDVNC
ncbi:hypothetical protein F511_11244 [Dorcoceras hygrometricum]|uniref:Uncharacterized protein n=1 Tax=Dorcoceras hygrometricum TaxID=472368 RepID=A0A2Z7BTT8_9LAMI|nr:hypothetical protein F511_11244 [Dorcoceras hygrometricum]